MFVSTTLKIRPSADEEHRVVDNDSNNNDLDHFDEYRIEFFAMQKSCSPSLTGTSQLVPLTRANGEAMWGRVKRASPFTHPQPSCQPPLLNAHENGNPLDGTAKYGSAYLLCSEKNGKSVMICLTQTSDTPQLAEEIFSTFRWTE